jgi:outer membrane autotransporter protein
VRVGPTNRRTDADYDTTTWSAFTELGLRMPIRQTSVLEPFGSLSFAYLREESFTESGAGAMDQHISSRSSNSLRSELGMRLQSQAASRSGLWVGELSAAWSHDYDIDDRTIHAGYVGAGGPSFALDGRDVSKDGTRLGADLTLHSRRGYKAALSVGSEIRQHLTSYMARLEITLPF